MSAPLRLALAALTAADLAAAPRYRMVLSADNADHGVSCVSFVENPAIGRGWVALSDVSAPAAPVLAPLKLSAEGYEQTVTGPALVPGLEILRLGADGKPYFISFDAATIKAAQVRFAEQSKQLTTNEAHSIALSGNVVFESWVVRDPERDPATVLGYTAEQVPAGTWMLTAHVPDAATWAKVQNGELTGFSIEALFDAEELKLHLSAAPAASAKMATEKKISLWARLTGGGKKDLAALALQAVTLEDDSQVDVAEDGTVSLLDAEGNITGPAPDGEHKIKGGGVLTVKDGKKVEAAKEPEKVDAAADGPAAAFAALAGVTADTPADEMRAALEKALGLLPKGDDKPGETQMQAVKLEAVPLADGTTVNYDAMTRKLTSEAGALLPSGDYKRKDGTCFRVNTDQYCYEIPAADYKAAEAVATELAAVKLELSKAKEQLATQPGGSKVLLGSQGGADGTSEKHAWQLRLEAAHANNRRPE